VGLVVQLALDRQWATASSTNAMDPKKAVEDESRDAFRFRRIVS